MTEEKKKVEGENTSNTTTLWEKEYHRVAKQIEDCKTELEKKSKKTNLEILRVNQLDALTLDNEIDDLVGYQFMSIFSFFQPEIIQKYKPELTALLELLIFRCSIWVIDTTVGKKLQNLKFANSECHAISKLQKVAYATLLIGGKWAWTRLNIWSSARDYGGTMRSLSFWKSLNHVETVYKVLSLLNFIVFLYDSKYPLFLYVTLLHRILGMRLIYDSPTAKRSVSFEYMNRQLVWHGFTEFLMFFLPLVNVQKIKSYISRMFYSPMMAQTSIPEGMCPVCRSDPVQTPYVANCGHVFCYYCLKQNCMLDAQYPCPRCGTKVREMKRIQVE